MAITPFTQPVQQTEFIPGKRRLPIQPIAEATGQYVERDVRNRDVIDKLQSELQQRLGRNEALSPVMDRYRQEIQSIAQDDLYADDTRRIQQLAREAQEDIGLIETQQKNIQEQQKRINELEGMPQFRKDQINRALIEQARLRTVDGRIDPQSIYQPRNIGEEADKFEVAKQALEGLRERTTRRGRTGEYSNLGLFEFFEETSIGTQRMKNAIMNSYMQNPKVQNWINNEMLLYQRRNPNKSQEDAREYAINKLDIIAQDIASNRSFSNIDYSRRNRPSGSSSGLSEDRSTLSRIGVIRDIESLDKDSTEYKERVDLLNSIKDRKLKSRLSPEEYERYQEINRNITEVKPSEGVSPMGRSIYTGATPGSTTVQQQREEAYKKAGIYDEIEQVETQAVQEMSKYGPIMFSPGEVGQREYDQFTRSLRSLPRSIVQSDDIDQQIEEIDETTFGINFNEIDESVRRSIKSRMLNSAEDPRISSDGRYIEFSVGDMPQEISGYDTSTIEGKNIRIPTDPLTENQLRQFTRNLSPEDEKTVISNWRYRDVPVTTEEWTNLGENQGSIRRNESNQFIIKKPNSDELFSVRDAINAAEDPLKKARLVIENANRMGYDKINSMGEFRKALQDMRDGLETEGVEQLQNLYSDPFESKHKGLAIEIGQNL